jgi:hypothetical protein
MQNIHCDNYKGVQVEKGGLVPAPFHQTCSFHWPCWACLQQPFLSDSLQWGSQSCSLSGSAQIARNLSTEVGQAIVFRMCVLLFIKPENWQCFICSTFKRLTWKYASTHIDVVTFIATLWLISFRQGLRYPDQHHIATKNFNRHAIELRLLNAPESPA